MFDRALCSSRSWTMSGYPWYAAIWSGVTLSEFGAFGFAPALSRFSTTERCPCTAASRSGLWSSPFRFSKASWRIFARNFCILSSRATSRSSCAAAASSSASCSAVDPLPSPFSFPSSASAPDVDTCATISSSYVASSGTNACSLASASIGITSPLPPSAAVCKAQFPLPFACNKSAPALSSSKAHSACPPDAATVRGLSPATFARLTSTSLSINARTASRWPNVAAVTSAVEPFLVFASLGAPASMSATMASAWPFSAASWMSV
mmetsp:Transcript_15009/g.49223  ORF Transcript_15009/g.49223 Transcript_15009/m.49223 type:complete len:265 (+) Transcript_15009:305-1099(+)